MAKGGVPNTRVQRTRSRSPLTRHPLGGRRVFAATLSVFVLAISPSLLARDGELSLRLAGAKRARIGHPVALTFTAVNAGRTSFYFMEPWWWDPKGLHIVATAADGSRTESTNVILDIDGEYLCTYLKPLSPGDQFSFQKSIVFGPRPVFDPASPQEAEVLKVMLYPHLDLRPGRYRLNWIYEPKPKSGGDESACTAGDWRIWSGRVESGELEVEVDE